MELQTKKRIGSIDMLRGLCVVAMVVQAWLGVFENTFESWAPLFCHDNDGFQILNGVSFADIFAPVFMFIVGMTMKGSLLSRQKSLGQRKGLFQIVIRYLDILGVGAILSGFDKIVGALENIGGLKGFSIAGYSEALGYPNVRVFALGFLIVLIVVEVKLLARLCNKKKLSELLGSVLRYSLAVLGLVMIYSVFAYTGDYFCQLTGGTVTWSFGTKVWDTLQNIGLAGLIALPIIKADRYEKLTVVSIVFIAMTALCNHAHMQVVRQVLEGGAISSVVWACIIILGSVFYEYHTENNNKCYWTLVAVLLVFSVIGNYVFGFYAAKRGCSPVYAAFSAAIAAVLFKAFSLFDKKGKVCPFLKAWGSNAIVLYIGNYILTIIACVIVESCELNPSKFVGLIIIIAVIALYSIPVVGLQKKEKFIRL